MMALRNLHAGSFAYVPLAPRTGAIAGLHPRPSFLNPNHAAQRKHASCHSFSHFQNFEKFNSNFAELSPFCLPAAIIGYKLYRRRTQHVVVLQYRKTPNMGAIGGSVASDFSDPTLWHYSGLATGAAGICSVACFVILARGDLDSRTRRIAAVLTVSLVCSSLPLPAQHGAHEADGIKL